MVGTLGLDGDEQADHRHHGGPDKAVYAYAEEDLDWWATQLGRTLAPGAFGENLTTRGVAVTGAVVGQHWRIGPVVLEVAQPRIPCSVFAAWMDQPAWVRRFTVAARPGAYLRVVVGGVIQAGDQVELVRDPDHRVTISEVFRARTVDRSLAARLVGIPELPDSLSRWAAEHVASGGGG
ncbi:MAG: MOSC domain-containing protein [Actinomycetes bacterium]